MNLNLTCKTGAGSGFLISVLDKVNIIGSFLEEKSSFKMMGSFFSKLDWASYISEPPPSDGECPMKLPLSVGQQVSY